MKGGKLTGGLKWDDDDEEAKEKYEYQALDANRKKGAMEQDLDAMLFGSKPAVRRRAPAETKPAEQAKPAEPTKPVELPKPNITPANQNKSIQIKTVVPVPNVAPNKPGIKPTESAVLDVNRSTDSNKNNTSINQTGGKVTPTPTVKPTITKKQPSILVPTNEIDTKQTISNILIESQQILPGKKVDNYVNPTKASEKKPEPVANIPAQPSKVDEVITIEVVHPFALKNQYNKPGNLRKLKKVAEDFKFAEENVTLHNAVDVVRPFETDRNRQKKLNDFDFKDFEFPSNSLSLGVDHKNQPSVWKRQTQLAKTVSFGKYIDPNDINPGLLSNPHFASTVSAIAQLQINTKRLIQDQKSNSNGFYLIRLFINSVWRYIAVDSLLPYINNEHAGIVSNPDSEFELSGALIEKAYAKVFGGYDTFTRVQPRENYLRDLTGAPVKKYSIENNDLGNIIKKAIASGQIVIAVPNQKIASVGLNPNFSYPLINYTSKGSMQLRSSFGTLEQRSKISLRPQGTFQLGSAQVRDLISHVLITNLNTAYSTTTIQSKHRHGFYSSYNFRVKNNTNGFLTISQWDERLFPINSGYQYSPIHVVLHRLEEDGNTTFINAGFTAGGRNLDLQVNLTPGNYTVFVSANWKHNDFSYNLTFYGSERVDFERIYTSKVPNLISHCLENLNVDSGKRTDLNKNSAQYFLYHHDSNLIVLTVENTSEKDGTVTADLTKVKLDDLVLLTSHNNEEDYSNKVAAEIEEYKQIPITDRRWSVTLEPHNRFTWILAASRPYSENNPKSWGFN